MATHAKKTTTSTFPLRLMPSVRKGAEGHSKREGVSLNQFINLAVAEKLAHMEHDQWLAKRPKATQALTARALAVLNKPTSKAAEDGDQIPTTYSRRRKTVGSRS
jgi:hypothetical protein